MDNIRTIKKGNQTLTYNHTKLEKEYNSVKLEGYPSWEVVVYVAENTEEFLFGSYEKIINDWDNFIDVTFLWRRTREGHEYWNSIVNLKPLPVGSADIPLNLYKALYE